MSYPIVCLSHLGWDPMLFQRPQQIMSRFAQRGHKVVFAGCVGWQGYLNQSSVSGRDSNGVTSLPLPLAPTATSLHWARRMIATTKLRSATRALPAEDAVLWLYHPALLDLGRALFPKAPIIYDVMDRFPVFRQSGAAVSSQESAVLKSASIVFTGGRSIDRSLHEDHRDVFGLLSHCLPSGVELEHFGRALEAATRVPEDLACLPKPVFGYFGAVDERMDFELLQNLAAAQPGGSVVLIGPILSTPPANLPSNVRLLGPRPYQLLPDYLKGFDVCLLPFRDSQLAATVSPTKTPEYLAGGRPVVSTPIPDVVADYGDIVAIGSGKAFVDACRQATTSAADSATLAREAARRGNTWDQIVDRMTSIIDVRFQIENSIPLTGGASPG